MEAQEFTFEELEAIRLALGFILDIEETSATEQMKTAFEKVERAIDEAHYQMGPCSVCTIGPLYIGTSNKE